MAAVQQLEYLRFQLTESVRHAPTEDQDAQRIARGLILIQVAALTMSGDGAGVVNVMDQVLDHMGIDITKFPDGSILSEPPARDQDGNVVNKDDEKN
jgi:hypothetical protein